MCLLSAWHRSITANHYPVNETGFAAKQDELNRHTLGRWIYNEEQQRARRTLRFNADALGTIAACAVGAKRCTAFTKISEGTNNKVLLLTFDNGAEAIARLPYPLVGPPHLVTASEVATIDFVRTVLHIPTPRVLAWSSRAASTAVGAEFIVIEKAPGVEFESLWLSIIHAERGYLGEISRELGNIERRFTSVEFAAHGSIFFKRDLDGYPRADRLWADGRRDSAEEKYAIGPLMEWDLWRGERVNLQVDRGPWKDALSYITGVIRCEQEWLRRYARPRQPGDPFFRSADNSPDVHIAVLDQFLLVVPWLLPSRSVLCRPTLWHTDMHRLNIFASPSRPHKITSIIDWQGMGIGPLYLQALFPKAMIYTGIHFPAGAGGLVPPMPLEYERLGPDERRVLEREQFNATMQRYHMVQVKKNKLHFSALAHPNIHAMLEPLYLATRTWHDGLHGLRHWLVHVKRTWPRIAGTNVTCPLEFSEDEMSRFEEEYERAAAYERRVRELRVQSGGLVSDERFEEVKRWSKGMMASWDERVTGGPYPPFLVCRLMA